MVTRTKAKAGAGTVRQNIVETLEAPRLTGITTEAFVKFKQNRAIYERRVQEKNNQDGVEVQLTSYRSSVEEPILALMLRAKWIEADSIEFITEDQLKACIEINSCLDPAEYDLAQIEAGIAQVKLGIVRKNLETKVWELDLR